MFQGPFLQLQIERRGMEDLFCHEIEAVVPSECSQPSTGLRHHNLEGISLHSC